jgi:hypothetical protein
MWQDYLYLPPGVDGQLNWIGGFIQLDETVEEQQEIAALAKEAVAGRGERKQPEHETSNPTIDLDPERGRPLSTYWHEVMHYVQTTTMSYLYKWTYTLLEKMLYAVSEASEQSVEEFVASGRLGVDLDKLRPVGKAVVEDLLGHLDRLDARGASGLSPRMIFESHAFITQWRLNHGRTADSGRALTIRELLSEFCPSDTYRVAYDFVRYYFGEEPAEMMFLPAAALSLCTADPVATFERIVFESATDTELHAAIGSADAEHVYQKLRQLAAADHYETAPQTFLANPDRRHPIYTAAAERLVEHAQLVDDFFRAPEIYIHQVLDAVTHPAIFGSPTADGIPFLSIPEQLDNAEGRALLGAAAGFAAAANAVLGSAYDYESISPRQEKSLHWLTRPSHNSLRITVDAESLASGDISAIRQALTPRQGRLVEAHAADSAGSGYQTVFVPAESGQDVPTFSWFELLWGRLLLAGEGGEQESEELWVPFMATLARQWPQVLAYLDLSSVWQQQMLHFSLSAPEPDGKEPDVVLLMAERVAAVGQHGVEVGVDPWIQARLLTARLPDELRDLLLQHPTFSQARSESSEQA